MSLQHPVRLFVNSNSEVASNLHQEFVRIKPKREGDREAIVTGGWREGGGEERGE